MHCCVCWFRSSIVLVLGLILGCQTVSASKTTRLYENIPNIDSEFADLALHYLKTGDDRLLPDIAKTAGARHIASHAKRVALRETSVTTKQLVKQTLTATSVRQVNLEGVRARLQAIKANTQSRRRCWAEAAVFLPKDALENVTLFLTIGYDIGVAVDGNASLNVAHQRFETDPQELWFTCVHEVNHAGFQSYHSLPRLADIKTNHQLASLIRYLTMMEGLAVHSTHNWRDAAGKIDADPDYVALQDGARMEAYENKFFDFYRKLAAGEPRQLEEQDWSVLGPMSTDERLWYRVGAQMAEQIEKQLGTDALVQTVVDGPQAFFNIYASLFSVEKMANTPQSSFPALSPR